MDKITLKQIEETINKSLLNLEVRLEKKFATKDDLKKMQNEITEDLTGVIQDFANELDAKKADKSQFAFLHDRITVLEEKIAA